MLKPFSGQKIVPSKWVRKMAVLEENGGRNISLWFRDPQKSEIGPKMAVFGENGGRYLRFWSRDPQKALPCSEPRRLTYFASKSVRASGL